MNMARPAACTRTKAAARIVSCSSRRSRRSNSVRFSVPIPFSLATRGRRVSASAQQPHVFEVGFPILSSGVEPLSTMGEKYCVAEMLLPLWGQQNAVSHQKGGDRDRSQGCTGPRGRTLLEDQARSVSQAVVTSE